MLTVTQDKIKLEDKVDVKTDLVDYLETYVRQFNQMSDAYKWIKDKLTFGQKQEWERTIKSISTVCQALNAGFEPFVPNANWASGQLFQYIAPMPDNVRKKIDVAVPIFGEQQILIYDPGVEHFRRPRNYVPVAIGFVTVANQRLQFCIGMWNIDKDPKFIDAPKGNQRKLEESVRNLAEVIRIIAPPMITQSCVYPGMTMPSTVPDIHQPYRTGDSSSGYRSNKWVMYMTTISDTIGSSTSSTLGVANG